MSVVFPDHTRLFLSNIAEEGRTSCFTLLCSGCLCSSPFPNLVMDWPVVCDCDISLSYPLAFNCKKVDLLHC